LRGDRAIELLWDSYRCGNGADMESLKIHLNPRYSDDEARKAGLQVVDAWMGPRAAVLGYQFSPPGWTVLASECREEWCSVLLAIAATRWPKGIDSAGPVAHLSS